MQHVRESQIIDVQSLASDFLATFFAGDGFANEVIACLTAHRDGFSCSSTSAFINIVNRGSVRISSLKRNALNSK
jgi:hypothetical protein